MKYSQLLPVFVLCILFNGSQLFAKVPETQLLFSITSNNTARLGIVNTSKYESELSITNSRGEPFFVKSVAGQEHYFQLFNLNEIPDGEYTVKLYNSEKTDKKQFVVKNSRVTLISEEEKEPTFYLADENTLIVSYINYMNRSVNVFFMHQDDVVFEERNITGNIITKKYSLKQLPPGNYEVKLYSGGKIYNYPVAIN